MASKTKEFRVDLHVHTCLSPCADLSMTPVAIVALALDHGLDGVAICDHNSAENVTAVRNAAAGTGLEIIGGMEITSSEEVHILGLFGAGDALEEMQRVVYDNLPGENDEAFFGRQVIMNEEDEAVGVCNRLLIGATTMGVATIVSRILALGGLPIASHVDRDSYSLIGQLGIVPDGLELAALGLSSKCVASGDFDSYRRWGFPLVTGSDAHFPADLGRSFTAVTAVNASFGEVAAAIAGCDGRAAVPRHADAGS